MTPGPDYQAYEAKLAQAAALEAEILPLNKAAIFDALEKTGMQTVVVSFDGYGDNGQIESMTARNAARNECEFPNLQVEFREVSFGEPAVTSQSVPLHEAINSIVFMLLDQTHGGWENDDGAFGEFTFNVADRSIALDYNERFTDSTYYQHEF